MAAPVAAGPASAAPAAAIDNMDGSPLDFAPVAAPAAAPMAVVEGADDGDSAAPPRPRPPPTSGKRSGKAAASTGDMEAEAATAEKAEAAAATAAAAEAASRVARPDDVVARELDAALNGPMAMDAVVGGVGVAGALAGALVGAAGGDSSAVALAAAACGGGSCSAAAPSEMVVGDDLQSLEPGDRVQHSAGWLATVTRRPRGAKVQVRKDGKSGPYPHDLNQFSRVAAAAPMATAPAPAPPADATFAPARKPTTPKPREPTAPKPPPDSPTQPPPLLHEEEIQFSVILIAPDGSICVPTQLELEVAFSKTRFRDYTCARPSTPSHFLEWAAT